MFGVLPPVALDINLSSSSRSGPGASVGLLRTGIPPVTSPTRDKSTQVELRQSGQLEAILQKFQAQLLSLSSG